MNVDLDIINTIRMHVCHVSLIFIAKHVANKYLNVILASKIQIFQIIMEMSKNIYLMEYVNISVKVILLQTILIFVKTALSIA